MKTVIATGDVHTLYTIICIINNICMKDACSCCDRSRLAYNQPLNLPVKTTLYLRTTNKDILWKVVRNHCNVSIMWHNDISAKQIDNVIDT